MTITHGDNLLVRIETQDGTVGWGEATSAPTMTGDTVGGLVGAVVEQLAPAIIGQDARFRPALVQRMAQALYGNTGARSAVEMALADLVGRATGLPLVDLLGGPQRDRVRPLWLLGTPTIEQDVAQARARQAEGYRFFKLKVGTKPVDDDIAGTLAVRAALGPDVQLCADANTGFTRAAARRYLDGIQGAGLLFLEQPLRHDDLDGMAMLARASSVPIGADEGIHSASDLEAHAASGAAAGASLKFIKLGGIAALLRRRRCASGAACRSMSPASWPSRASPRRRSSMSAARCPKPIGASARPMRIWPRIWCTTSCTWSRTAASACRPAAASVSMSTKPRSSA
ncbi:MAG: enolase C-terminal domain-like protein [Pseudomonadota bacterium]